MTRDPSRKENTNATAQPLRLVGKSVIPARTMLDPVMARPSSVNWTLALKRLGFDQFRPGQQEAIETLLERKRLLLVAPTGGGKSLVYQLPASVLAGTTVVVSPLISLMNDQVTALTQRGVPATYLASTLSSEQQKERVEAAKRGVFKLIYVAPERLAFAGFRALLRRLECPLLVIDEAHCISEWGHDFRPEYLQIRSVIDTLPEARVLACTATATPIVRDEILAHLGLPAETPQLVRGFARPNLVLRAREVSKAREREQATDGLLLEVLGKPKERPGCAIVYSPTRRKAEAEAERLSGRGWKAAAYHAGMDPQERERVQADFIAERLQVVCATNAFGMGIDRSDVRAVVHLAPPGSVEAYYQEVGRAGRDGQTAWGLMLSSHQDIALRRRLIQGDGMNGPVDPAVVEHKWNLFLELMRWAEGGSCRHDAILRYFGTEDIADGGCGRCDVCASLGTPEAVDAEHVATTVRKALSGVARIHGRFGLTLAVKLLRGEHDQKLVSTGLHQVSTFGILKEHDDPWLVRLLRRCVTAGWVNFSGSERPTLLLTAEGIAVMKGERPARLLLPNKAEKAQASRSSDGEMRTKPASGELDASAQPVFEALRAHRLEIARAQGVPPYVVASDRTLRELAILRPRTQHDLLLVHGIGPGKAERYGEGLLRVIRNS